MRSIGCFETSSANYQLTRRRRARNWSSKNKILLLERNVYKYQNKINSVTFVYICRFAVQLPKFQRITTNVSDNNKQYRYISVLLLWSQIVLVCLALIF